MDRICPAQEGTFSFLVILPNGCDAVFRERVVELEHIHPQLIHFPATNPNRQGILRCKSRTRLSLSSPAKQLQSHANRHGPPHGGPQLSGPQALDCFAAGLRKFGQCLNRAAAPQRLRLSQAVKGPNDKKAVTLSSLQRRRFYNPDFKPENILFHRAALQPSG